LIAAFVDNMTMLKKKLTIFHFLEGQLVDDKLPHGALTEAANFAGALESVQTTQEAIKLDTLIILRF
jgi:hypothetical protein